MIQIEGLTRRFHDVVAVDDISLRVDSGEILGFIGPNGAGKSTTIRILTGFLPATSGRAVVAGFDVATDSLKVRRRIGYCPENVPMPLDARVDEYLEFRARLKGLSPERRRARREEVVRQCGLAAVRRRLIGQLSRGYRQRVGLSDALLTDPEVLILDEPTGGLDPGQRQEVLDLVAALKGRRTVLLSSHVLAEVEQICSRIAIIQAGRIVARGTKQDLLEQAGRRGEVRMAVQGDQAPLTAWLAERGIEVSTDAGGRSCTARIADDVSASELLRAAMDAGLAVDRFEPLSRSLHEIYLHLTMRHTVAAQSAAREGEPAAP